MAVSVTNNPLVLQRVGFRRKSGHDNKPERELAKEGDNAFPRAWLVARTGLPV